MSYRVIPGGDMKATGVLVLSLLEGGLYKLPVSAGIAARYNLESEESPGDFLRL
jgi:hypothetical protein